MVLMDLSKACNCLPHDLLIAKLDAYGVGIDSLKLIYSYLTDKKQRVEIGTSFSTWKSLSKGVPQGSVLSPLLLNFFGLKENHELSIEINGDVMKMFDTVKLLGFIIYSKLRFNEHVKIICQKTNNKVKAFSGVVGCLEPQKASLLYRRLAY